jgi:hypothetical protein
MGSMLRRLAPVSTTGVGSLPFTRPAEAVRHAAGAYELPFCPQLPRAYGDMVHEWLGADPGRCGWAPDRDRQLPTAWDDFILHLGRHPPSAGLVKLQVTGPLTLAMALERRSPAGRTDMPDLAREIADWLAAAVSDQLRGLRELGLGALVVVDEPGLMAAHRQGATAAVWDPLRAAAPGWGLHVCGEVPWRLLDAAEPDLISYDLIRYGCGRAAQAVVRRLMRRGGRVMWGAADPLAPESPSLIVDRVWATARGVAGRRWRTADVLDASLLSGTCGTGGVEVTAERRLARDLGVAASLLRGDQLPVREWDAGIGNVKAVRERTVARPRVLTSPRATTIRSDAKRESPGGKG